MLRAEKFLMGSSAARETELSMMKTRMRLVNMWWLMSLWQKTRNLRGRGHTVRRSHREENWLEKRERFLRVGGAEDKEGASLWNGSDLLLLHQIGDDRPRPRRNLWILLLPRRVVVVLVVLLRSGRDSQDAELEHRPSAAFPAAPCWPRIPCRLCRPPFYLCDKQRWVTVFRRVSERVRL